MFGLTHRTKWGEEAFILLISSASEFWVKYRVQLLNSFGIHQLSTKRIHTHKCRISTLVNFHQYLEMICLSRWSFSVSPHGWSLYFASSWLQYEVWCYRKVKIPISLYNVISAHSTLCSAWVLFLLKKSKADLTSVAFLDFCCRWLGATDPVLVNLDWNISFTSKLLLAEKNRNCSIRKNWEFCNYERNLISSGQRLFLLLFMVKRMEVGSVSRFLSNTPPIS